MTTREKYSPGPAAGANVLKQGDTWTLVLVRDFRQPPAKVWRALTDPAELREWAPFDADRDMGTTGPVTLSTVATPKTQVSDTMVTRAEAPRFLEYRWGENDMRWELAPLGAGTRLTLWHSIGRRYVAMGAAGWHICFDVLAGFLAGRTIGRIVGGNAMSFDWKRLHAEYSKQFGVDPMDPPTTT
jgi:uncharacterized protein YndB with AHSA1/START domain